jgi:hypothetical protein
VTPSESAASERECGCPPWVIRCVHIDGTVALRLFWWGPPYPLPSASPQNWRYHLCDGEGHVEGKGFNLDGWCYLPYPPAGNDLAAALAAFHAAESRLLAEAELEREGMGHVSVARAGGE